MGENVPALFCLDASNPEKMITAGFIDIQNGRWVKLLTETEFKEVLIYTVDDSEARVTSHNERIEELKASMDNKQTRMKELQALLEQAQARRRDRDMER